MIKCLLYAPINEFFDRVPIGRILNRLSYNLTNFVKINIKMFIKIFNFRN